MSEAMQDIDRMLAEIEALEGKSEAPEPATKRASDWPVLKKGGDRAMFLVHDNIPAIAVRGYKETTLVYLGEGGWCSDVYDMEGNPSPTCRKHYRPMGTGTVTLKVKNSQVVSAKFEED